MLGRADDLVKVDPMPEVFQERHVVVISSVAERD